MRAKRASPERSEGKPAAGEKFVAYTVRALYLSFCTVSTVPEPIRSLCTLDVHPFL